MNDFTNLQLLEEKYLAFTQDPMSVSEDFRYFFYGVEFSGKKESLLSQETKIFDAYRKHGHLLGAFDPLQTPLENAKELDIAGSEELHATLRRIYCGKIGFECSHVSVPGLQEWIYQKIEKEPLYTFSSQDKERILLSLHKAESFERFIHTKYLGQTRFSLEGNDALIPMLEEIVRKGAQASLQGFVLGMSHRGRLNVLTNILKKPYAVVFKEFEDAIAYIPGEGGDVKYHKGFSSDIAVEGKSIHLHLCANSSALESVDGIALGLTKAYQVRKGGDFGAIVIHGDAAFAGQGVVYETLQMSSLDGFSVGGAIHIALDNKIGYTTVPEEGRSTRYCTDIAKTFGIPVLHVNAEDVEGCVFAAHLSLEIRMQFGCDVFINLHGYRKYGHNEGDEPLFTQPLLYKIVQQKKTAQEIYVEKLQKEGVTFSLADFKEDLSSHFEQSKKEENIQLERRFGVSWKEHQQPSKETFFVKIETAVKKEKLDAFISAYAKIPEGFHLHPKLVKWLEDRKNQLKATIDWGCAECLAFCSLLGEGISVRLAGQDVKRGTFSHRHAVWFDQTTGLPYTPFSHIALSQGRFDVHNTILSEYGSLAFEFGYSWGALEKHLTLWEAQYGDFDNGAQIIIDHYLVAGEEKWTRYSSLVLLLPHGYEGAGPEHSSARVERFLQLAAEYNIQVASPSTPAQFFHLLRRQALQKIKKPLIVLTPKSLLRLPACTSPLSDFTEGSFAEIIDDAKAKISATKLIFCSGKVYYDILAANIVPEDAALIRIEQLYPFHEKLFMQLQSRYTSAKMWIFIQEEPENMGAASFLRPYFLEAKPASVVFHSIARPKSGATATGSKKRHQEEQATLLKKLQERLRGEVR